MTTIRALRFVCALPSLLVLASAALADAAPLAPWERIAVPGPLPTAALVDDPHDDTIWAAGARGVLRSDDQGISWSQCSANLSGDYRALAVDPDDPEQLWVVGTDGSLSRSLDRGVTWRLVSDMEEAEAIAFGADGTLYVADRKTRALWVSDDDGAMWDVRPAVGLPYEFAAASGTPGLLLYSSGAEVFRSADGGRSWTPVLVGGNRVIVADPHGGETFYVGGNPLHVTRDGGISFSELVPPIGVTQAIGLDPEVEGRIAVTGFDGAVAESFDGGTTWTLRVGPREPEVATREVAVLPVSRSPRILVGGERFGRGLLERVDADRRTEILPPVAGFSDLTFDGSEIRGIGPTGLRWSTDGGDSWIQVSTPGFTPTAIEHGSRVGGAAVTLWAIGLDDLSGELEIHVSVDQGASWLDRGSIAPDNVPSLILPGSTALRARAVTAEIVEGRFVATRVWLTDDGGETWTDEIERGLGQGEEIFDVTVDPDDPEHVWLATLSGVFEKSPDDPEWRRLPETPWLVEIVAVGGERLYGTDAMSSWLRSTDGGLTWERVGSAVVDGVVVSPLDPDHLAGSFYADGALGISFDGGVTWLRVATPLTRRALPLAWGPDGRLWIGAGQGGTFVGHVEPDLPLALQDSRFLAEIAWRDFDGNTGTGRGALRTDDTGTFWFFDESNLELMVKVLDGRGVNGKWWVFYGASTNVEFTLTVTDRVSGEEVVYFNPLGTFASFGDVDAFEAVEPAGLPEPPDAVVPIAPGEPTPDLVLGDRFVARVLWRDFEGDEGGGLAVPLAEDTGAFWFFDESNLELMVKVLDGRAVNGRWWVFFGSLTNVAFTLEVTDLETGAVARYDNPLGTFASVGDIEAF